MPSLLRRGSSWRHPRPHRLPCAAAAIIERKFNLVKQVCRKGRRRLAAALPAAIRHIEGDNEEGERTVAGPAPVVSVDGPRLGPECLQPVTRWPVDWRSKQTVGKRGSSSTSRRRPGSGSTEGEAAGWGKAATNPPIATLNLEKWPAAGNQPAETAERAGRTGGPTKPPKV